MPHASEGRRAAHQRGRLASGGPLADHIQVKATPHNFISHKTKFRQDCIRRLVDQPLPEGVLKLCVQPSAAIRKRCARIAEPIKGGPRDFERVRSANRSRSK
jgi:hypothetical protein